MLAVEIYWLPKIRITAAKIPCYCNSRSSESDYSDWKNLEITSPKSCSSTKNRNYSMMSLYTWNINFISIAPVSVYRTIFKSRKSRNFSYLFGRLSVVLFFSRKMVRFFALFLSLFCVGHALNYSRYAMSVLQNAGLQSFQRGSEDQCVASCSVTSGCSAISYSEKLSQCMVSMCGNLKLVVNAFWNTVVLGK